MIEIGKFCKILALLGVSASPSEAEKTTLVLGDAEGENVVNINLRYAGIFEDEQPTVYSGTIEAELGIDTETDRVTSFEMTGGRIAATDMTFVFDAGFFGSQTILLLDAKATPLSPEGAEALATPGVFTAPRHVFEFDEGRTETSGSFGEGEGDVADDPFYANGETVGTITLSNRREVMSSLNGKLIALEYDTAFSVDLGSSSTSEVDGQEVGVDTRGVVTAAGAVRVPVDDFYEWAFQNAPEAGPALGFDADADGNGVVDGVSWALGYPPTGGQSGVFVFNRVENRLEIPLAPTGSRSEFRIMTSDSLRSDDWEEVPASEVSTGANPVPAGETGEVFVTVGRESKRFFRLEVAEP